MNAFPGTYESLIRMHIRKKNLPEAISSLQEMKSLQIQPTRETYGLLIRDYTARDMIVDALHILEEASDKNILIHGRNLEILRNRCSSLGIKHPNLGDDPKAWVKDVKTLRKKLKNAPRRKIQSVESVRF